MELLIAGIATLILLAVPRFDPEREDIRRELAQRQRQALVKTATRRRRSGWQMATAAFFAAVGGLLAGLWHARLPLAAIVAPAMLGFALLAPGELPGAFLVSGVAALGAVVIPLLSVRALEGRSHHRELLGVVESVRAVWGSTPAWARIGDAALVVLTASSPALSLVLPRVAGVISLAVGGVLYATMLVLSLAGLRAIIARRLAEWARIEEARRGVAASLRLPDSAAAELVVHVEGERLAVELPVRAGVLEGDLESRLVGAGLTQYAYDLEAHPGDGRHVLWMRPVDADTMRRRALAASSNGLVVNVADVDGTHVELTLPAGTSPARAAEVAAWVEREFDGYTMTIWEPYRRRAAAERMTDIAKSVRARISALLRTEPWSIKVEVAETPDGDRIDTVVVDDAPPAGKTPDERRAAWKALCLSLPSGGNGWSVDEDISGRVTLRWGPPRQLPKTVPGVDILPQTVDHDQWQTLTYGLTERGTPAAIDLKAGPHSLVVGGTGSGKTYATRMILLAAYSRGFEVVVIDPTKRAAGLRDMDPYAKLVATESKRQAARVLSAVYDEVQRRVDLTEQYKVEGWRQLPKSLGVRPWLIVVDEYAGLIASKLQKPMDRKSEAYAEWEAEATDIDTIKNRMANLAAEARSAGIHVVVVTQTAYAEILSGQMRQNLGTVIQLVPPARPPARTQLGMVFTPEDVAAAEETITALNDGRSAGFAVSAVDGAGVSGVRVGFIQNERPDPETGQGQLIQDDVDYLERLGVPPGVPLELPAETAAVPAVESGPVTGRRIIEQPADEQVVDLGIVDLGDFDLGADEFAAIPTPVVAPAAKPQAAADLLDDLFN